MQGIRRCGDHGHFAGEACPACGASGESVLDGNRRKRLSTFLSGALRHFPEDVGIAPDERGWVERGSLVAAATRKYDWAEPEHVDAVIATDPKGRYERDGERVRAAYGHSIDVDLGEGGEESIPDRLYHGTAPRNLDAIRREGLKPMGRRQVHLSGTREEAEEVGRRHAPDPVVLVVDAAGMARDGRRVAKRGRGTYTVDRVPPEYVEFP